MSRLSKPAKPFFAEAFKILLGPVVICVLYAVVRFFFDNATETEGLLTPEKQNLLVIVAAAATLLLRGIVLFVLPPVVAFRVTVRLFGFFRKRQRHGGA